MAKNTKPLRIIRPNSAKRISKQNIQAPVPQNTPERTEKAQDHTEPKQPGDTAENKENTWSDWQWSDQDGGFYYRAQRSADGLWQYEYTRPIVQSSESSNASQAREQDCAGAQDDSPIDDVVPQYLRMPVEYPRQGKKIIYVTEKSYSYQISPSGENYCSVEIGQLPEEEEVVPPSAPPVKQEAKEPQAAGSQAADPEPEIRETSNTEAKKAASKSLTPRKRGKEKQVGVDRVSPWIETVNNALNQDSEGEFDVIIAKDKGGDAEDKRKEKHSRKREDRYREQKLRR